jgi:hypothetical protein
LRGISRVGRYRIVPQAGAQYLDDEELQRVVGRLD